MNAGDSLILIRRHPFVTAVEAGLARCGVGAGDRVLAAVSGGADSTALLLALIGLASLDKWAIDVQVAHVNHHLRDAADGEEAFVADLAGRWGLRFHRRDIRPADSAGNLEANARRMRYAALADIAVQIDADHIATAHHADDQLETLLLRLVRGAGRRGLRGVLPVKRIADRRVIRPMLMATHAEANAFLRDFDQPWCEDATNSDVTRSRALLRARVLPVLRRINPQAARNAARAADHLRQGR